ncbi:hypothetical protein D9M73_109040 [compost metagenome]
MSSAASVSSNQPNTAPASPTGPGTASPAKTPITTQPSSICQCRESIEAPQARHRPRASAALSNGTKSRGASVTPQASHCDRPRATDRPSGQRTTIVARKLPTSAPRTPNANGQSQSVMGSRRIRA